MPVPRPGAAVAALVLLALGVACTPASRAARSTTTDHVTQTITRPAPSVRRPSSAPPVPTGALPQPQPVAAHRGNCPYLDTIRAQNLNGSKIDASRNEVVTTTPVGCRFYALDAAGYGQKGAAGRIEIEISTARYRTASDAEQGMVRTALKGRNVNPVTVRGHKAAQFQTRFSPSDGNDDWACTFYVGKLVVTVKTDRTDLALNAVNIATAIAPKFD